MIVFKICANCIVLKSFEDFYNCKITKDRKQSWCISCKSLWNTAHKEDNRGWKSKYRENNRPKIRISASIYRELNREELNRKTRENYHTVLKYDEDRKNYVDNWRIANQPTINEQRRTPEKRVKSNARVRKKRKEDICYRIHTNFSCLFRQALKKNKDDTKILLASLGYTIQELKSYIESLWLNGMSWENYGLGFGK